LERWHVSVKSPGCHWLLIVNGYITLPKIKLH
jgi:hypothetical protein